MRPFFILLLTFLMVPPLWAQGTIDFGRYHALVIGNEDYKFLTPLKTPIEDATEVARILREKYGFNTTLLQNATRRDIMRAMNRLRKLTRKDNLLIYYAGHGHLDEANNTGYWQPVDAEPDYNDNWIPTTAINRELSAMNAKHIIVVADSCYAGTLLTRASESSLPIGVERQVWLQRMASKGSRTALTSGGLEPVLDSGGEGHSVFARAFLDVLKNNEKILDGDRLFDDLKNKVVRKSPQTPRYADIRSQKNEGGDFLLVPKQLRVSLGHKPPANIPDSIFRGQDLSTQVNPLLRECQAHLDANRLTTGRGGNAADCYEEVLKQDRGNPEALEGLTAIEKQYRSWAEKALKQGRLDRAKSYIAKIELFNPEGDTVFELKEQIRKAERGDDPLPKPKTISTAPVATTNQRLVGEMIPIKGGCFQMGSPADEEGRDGDERQHRVCVGDFKIGKTEVTQQQWREVMGSNPSDAKGCDDCPVENVSWNDVQDFLQKLNVRSGMKFSLPTEAKWEYAARAGTTGPFSFQGKISADKVNYYANQTYEGSSRGQYRGKTVRVSSLPANPWGLHEVHGNVWEWTCSAYDENYGGSEKKEEKCAGRNGSGLRVLRGGSWGGEPGGVRSAARGRYGPGLRGIGVGFRLAQD